MTLTILDATKDPKYNIDINELEDLEFDGINHSDYPDYCDAYISSASIREEGKSESRDLTEEELEWVMDQHPDWFYNQLIDSLH